MVSDSFDAVICKMENLITMHYSRCIAIFFPSASYEEKGTRSLMLSQNGTQSVRSGDKEGFSGGGLKDFKKK